MKITFVIPAADLSGGNRVIAVYADQLARRGHQVTVVSRPWTVSNWKSKLKAFIKRRPRPNSIAYGPSHLDALTTITHRRIDRHRPIEAPDVPDADVVIATWWETAEWVAAYPPSKGAKVYFIQHFETHPPIPPHRVEATWRLPMQKIVIAKWLLDLAEKQFGDTRAALVPNAVDLDQFNAPPRGKQPMPTVGFMYSTVPFKACEVSLEAVRMAHQRVRNLRLVSFGNRATSLSLMLPPGTDYTMRPAQDKIKEIYAKADVWLVSSRSEGFGLPILEAMACRTPVIATPTGAAPELLSGGGGLIVPFDSPQAMADAIVQVVSQRDFEWKELSDRAYQTATSYTWESATDRFEKVLLDAAAKK